MEARRVRSIAVFIAFICILGAGNSEGNRKFPEAHSGNGVPGNVQEIDEDTAGQVWIHCRKELEENTKAFEDFDLYIPQEAANGYNEIKPDVALSTKRIIPKAISDLPPKFKYCLLDSLRKKNLSSRNSGEEAGSKTWFINNQEQLTDWSGVRRRYLADRRDHDPVLFWTWWRKHKHMAVAAAQRRGLQHGCPPDPGPVPATALIANDVAVGPTTPAQGPLSVDYPPAPSVPVPTTSPPPTPQFPPEAAEPSHPSPRSLRQLKSTKPPKTHKPPKSKKSPKTPHHPSHKNSDDGKYTTVIVASAAVGAFSLFMLFLFCCLKGRKNRIGPRDGQRDDKPLLNFCSSSSQNSGTARNSINKDFRNPSIVHNKSSSSVGRGQLLEGASEKTQCALPLPPGRVAPPTPQPPPPPPPKPPAPSPPPPPKVALPPNPPKFGNLKKPPPPGPHHQGRSSAGDGKELSGGYDSQKTKLKPFFWDKVMANPDHAMVWHEIKAGSFQFNEEQMESLFGYIPADKEKNNRRKDSESSIQYIQIIDRRKAQNLAILLKALNVTTEEVCDALKEGNELPVELIQTLLKIAPTTDEELKLRLYNGDLSQLGPAEQFLKVLVDIPFAFKRLEALLFMCSHDEEVSSTKESFATLEVACEELRNSRLFLKLLEAVLKTGNRMNDGTFRGGAQAFKLDTLLKLSDVKGIDGKTTLLHFVVQEIIRSEGLRAARKLKESLSMSSVKTEDLEDSAQESPEYYCNLGLQVVSGLSNELEGVRKASVIDGDILTGTVSGLGSSLAKTREFLENELKSAEEQSEFQDILVNFLPHAEADVTWLLEEEKRIMALVKSTGDYFHGKAGKDEGLHLFVIISDFLIMLEKACKEVRNSAAMPTRTPKKEGLTPSSSRDSVSRESLQQPSPDPHQRLFPAIKERRMDDFSSDEESSSP